MRPTTGPPTGSTRLAPRGRRLRAAAGTALAATALAVFAPAPQHAVAATAPAGPLLYAGNCGSGDSITAYDLTVGGVVAVIPTDGATCDLAFSPDASTVYATESNGELLVVNVATSTITARIPVGQDPAGLAVSPDGGTVYVANSYSSSVSVVNTATDTVTATIPVEYAPQGVAISPDGSTVYVADRLGGAISVISTATDTVTGTIPFSAGYGPSYLAFSPNGATVYATDGSANSVWVINTATEAVTATVPVGGNPTGLAVNWDGSAVYVADYSGGVSVISTATDTVTATVPTPAGTAEVAASPDGGPVFASSATNNTDGVAEINPGSDTVVGELSGIPTGYGLAVSPEPQVDSISPDGGPVAGGNQVTLTGVGFENVLNVTFGGAEASSYTVTSPTTITATVPPGRAGPVYAFVTTYRGDSSTTPGSQYTYQVVPTVTGVSPYYGPASGGGLVTITGTGFSGPVTVMFGTKSATISSQSSTQLQVAAPSGTAGTTVYITVGTSVGTSAPTSSGEYSYIVFHRYPIPLARGPVI